ncbi:uncharacterized protein LOC126687576 [Mercurialis annua]|uniref:uncharacterized protein LOC126687576 n=1 Tax=Mercurialis annua TaxID=3986 RepID=UPI00215F4B1A|nr:uncharacterized protein LOC126687576 [Mercurialis annua]
MENMFINDCLVINPTVPDKVIWKLQKNGVFTVNSAWKEMNSNQDRVSWHSIVWFPGQIPRHSFVTWLALLGRLNTKDKLIKWGVINSNVCSLCNQEAEDIEHLFFDCCFSAHIWGKVLRCNDEARQKFCWRREVSYFCRRYKGKSVKAKLRKLWFNATVYHIWGARNNVIFNQGGIDADMIFSKIEFDVKNRAS